jgi:hypothetical protein
LLLVLLAQAMANQGGSNGLVLDRAWLTPTAQQLLDKADELVVQHMLQAMAHQSASGSEARLFLPAVLSALSQPQQPAPPTSSSGRLQAQKGGAAAAGAAGVEAAELSPGQQAFQEHWRGVPVGVFLPWVSQMLSRLGEPEGQVLKGPLEELAKQ